MTPFSTSAPGIKEMSRSDQIHAANMADYASQLEDFKASPLRTAAANISYISGCFGSLGMGVVTPVVSCVVKGGLAYGLTLGASSLCCIACCTGLYIAKEPKEPRHPDRPVDNTNYGG